MCKVSFQTWFGRPTLLCINTICCARASFPFIIIFNSNQLPPSCSAENQTAPLINYHHLPTPFCPNCPPPKSHSCALQDTEAIPEHKGSSGVSVEEQGSFSTSLQVPDASAQHGLQAESAMPPKSNANGLAPEDVSVDMPGQLSMPSDDCDFDITARSQHVHSMFTAYSQHVHSMFS